MDSLSDLCGVELCHIFSGLSTLLNACNSFCVLQMYVQCTVNLCIATLPSQKCPDLCSRSVSTRTVVNSVFTKSYTIQSGPVSLVFTTPQPSTLSTITPATTTTAPTTTTTTTTTVTSTATPTDTTTSHGKMWSPKQASDSLFVWFLVVIMNEIKYLYAKPVNYFVNY